MKATAIIFWATLGILVYTYFGYGLVLIFLSAFRKKRPTVTSAPAEKVTVIIPAYNEASILNEKVKNTQEALAGIAGARILVVTDGSNDGSDLLQWDSPLVTHLHRSERRGKSAAINRAMALVDSGYVIITDANALVNREAFHRMLKHYDDPRVGGVSGEKRVMVEDAASSVGGEGLYWKYESYLKRRSAEFYTVVGAAGELFSFRRIVFTPLEEDAILDDFMLSMRIVKKGFRIAYEPEAYALEKPSRSISDEFSRKVRISSGVWQTLGRLPFLFNPFADPRLFFQFISHRFLRWTLAPVSLIVLFAVNLFLLHDPFFRVFFILQIGFYFLALLGFLLRNQKLRIAALFVPFYYCMMNFAVLAGLVKYLRGDHSVLWKKAERT